MLNIDQAASQLNAGNIPGEPATRPGITLTANVIPGRTQGTTTNCLNLSLYPSWADLSNLSQSYGLDVVSASQSYLNMTALTQQQQVQQSCGSLSSLIGHGFHRAWGLFAYPNNHYTTTVQSSVVDNCFAFGRTYVKPGPVTTVANHLSTTAAPWFQKTADVGGGRCHLTGLPCSTYNQATLGLYASPLTLAGMTKVAPGDWVAMQAYSFVTGSSNTGSYLWDCTSSDWHAHWTSLFEIYCWNDYLYALSQIPSNVVVTDPATVAEAWGRIPAPHVVISSTTPATLTDANQSSTISWNSWENGSYSAYVGGNDCTTGSLVAGGTYATAPATTTVSVSGTSLALGANTIRICLTNDPGHTGSATTTVNFLPPPGVTQVSPNTGPLSGGETISITGSNFMSGASVNIGGAAASGVIYNSATSMTATVPPAPGGNAGQYDVLVTDAGGTSQASSNDLFQYEAAPTVTSLIPNTGPAAGGNSVTINGSNFYAQDPNLAVQFGGSPATGAVVTSVTTINVVAPPGTSGSVVDVQVTDSGGTSQSAPPGDSYTYTL
jgi:hypothetical protein